MTTTQKLLDDFVKVRTDAISEMFDNPDDCGIYPTTKFFNKLDEAFLKGLKGLMKSIK